MATELEKFAWPGGYTLLYVFTQSREHLVLCWECATKAVKGIEQGDENFDGYSKEGSYINWEGESSWCDDCGVELPSEYGNPNKEENEPQVGDSSERSEDAGELACEKTPTIVVDSHNHDAILPDEVEPTLAEIRHQEKLHHEFANPER